MYGLNNKKNCVEFFNDLEQFDIIILLETWCTKETYRVTQKYFKNFTVEYVDGVRDSVYGRYKGGMILGYKKNLEYEVSFKYFNAAYPFLVLKDSNVSIVPVYLNNWERDFENLFNYVIEYNLYNDCVLIGDFNAWIGTLQILDEEIFESAKSVWNMRKSCATKTDTKGIKLIEKFNENNLIVLNGRCKGDEDGNFTYKKNNNLSVIDFAACSANLLPNVEELKVIWSDLSDHNQLALRLQFNLNTNVSKETLLPKIKWNAQASMTRNLEIEQIVSTGNFSECNLNRVKEIICNVFNTKSTAWKGYKEKWYDKECFLARQESFNNLNKWRMCRLTSTGDDANSLNLYAIYKASNKKYRIMCQWKKQLFYESVSKKLSDIRNATDWWSWANVLKDDVKIVINGSVSLENLVSQFSSLFNNKNINGILYCEPLILDEVLDVEFTREEFDLAVSSLKDKKAAGEDRIPIECYKYGPDCLKDLVLQCFNDIFNGKVNVIVNNSIIVALHKKGDRNLASNYRGISLINSSDKLFGKLMFNRLNSWIKNKGILTELQAGFREGYSTADNIFNFYQIIEQSWQRGKKKIYCFFVDFKAAFDGISSSCLFYKLFQLGVSSKFCEGLKTMYVNTQNSVWYDGNLSEWFNSSCGVKQGCINSPLLFSLFVNDLPKCIKGGINLDGTVVNVLMYADDIVLFAETPRQLQLMINRLYEYCTKWNLIVNTDKSQIMIMKKGAGRKANDEQWYYNRTPIEVVKKYKYLGMTIMPSLSLNLHFKEKNTAGKFKVFSVWKKRKRLGFVGKIFR